MFDNWPQGYGNILVSMKLVEVSQIDQPEFLSHSTTDISEKSLLWGDGPVHFTMLKSIIGFSH